MSNRYAMRTALISAALMILSVCPVVQAGSFTDRENIQDTGIRINHAAINSDNWALITSATTGTYFSLSQFDVSDVDGTVTSATLDIWLRETGGTIATHNITVYLLNQADEDWVEAEANGFVKSTAAGAWVGGSRPYDLTGESVTAEWTPSSPNVREAFLIDVRDLVQQMVDEGRPYGTFYITDPDMPDWEQQTTVGQKEINWGRPPGGSTDYCPQLLSVESSGDPRYSLTVISGTTSRIVNLPGSVVDIDADTAPQYSGFDAWVGDTTGITDLNAASTTMTTQAADATITATYIPLTYSLTVDNGSGDGVYDVLSVTPISADSPAAGETFYLWVGDTADVANTADANTTITMYGDAAVTATYRGAPVLGDLNGDGACDVIDLNMILIDWGKSMPNLADPNADPSGDGTVTVVDLNMVLIDWGRTAAFILTVTSGSGSGEYTVGSEIAISADAPPFGEDFREWIGDTASVADPNAADTTITLPLSDTSITATFWEVPHIRLDYGVYPELPLPTLPPAGGTYIDEVFGTEIMRVTDETDGTFSHVAGYSFYDVFNVDSTKLFVHTDGTNKLYDFDPNTFQISNKRNLWQSQVPGGGYLRGEDASWSHDDPNVIYGHFDMKIYSYNVATNSYTLIKDMSAEIPDPNAVHSWNMFMDRYSNRFTFVVQDSEWNRLGMCVWDRATDQMILYKTGPLPHSVNLDKSGDWFYLSPEGEPGGISCQITDLTDVNNVVDLTKAEPDYAPGHRDFGYGVLYGAGINNAITKRDFATPHSFTNIFYWSDWTQGYHISNRDDNEDWITVSCYVGNDHASTGQFKDEIFQVATDGSFNVRRLAHHRTWFSGDVGGDYWNLPFASISRCGRFIAYGSNWENSGRTDVFIVKIPPAP